MHFSRINVLYKWHMRYVNVTYLLCKFKTRADCNGDQWYLKVETHKADNGILQITIKTSLPLNA